MLGLIKKDLLMIKNNIKILLILFIFYIVMYIQGEVDLIAILPIMSVIIFISTFSYDEYNKWNSYACTLPNGRENVVKSKYLATLLVVLITIFVVAISFFVISYSTSRMIDYKDFFSNIFGVLFATIFLESIFYPAIYKFGVEKARIGVFVVVFGVSIVGGILNKFINFSSLINAISSLESYLLVILPILMVLMITISYKISEKINLKKEY